MEVRQTLCKNAASKSGLPGLDWALNPYRGCSHACRYCYAQDVTRFEMARDWGEVVEVKTNFVQMLQKQLSRKPRGTFGLGTVTDPYQPLEKEYELSRESLKELKQAGSSVSVLTKSDLVVRDLDLLQGWRSAEVGVSLGSVEDGVAAILEPGAPSPIRRLDALKKLSDGGVDTYVMAAPIIPGISDSEAVLRSLVCKVAGTGAKRIMWDKFNPKPMASQRLRKLAPRGSMVLAKADEIWISRVRRLLSEECEASNLELLEAF